MKSHEQKRRHVSARWHNQMVTWSLGPAADGGSWRGWTWACQQPAPPAEAGAITCSGLTHLDRVSLQTQEYMDVACCTTPPGTFQKEPWDTIITNTYLNTSITLEHFFHLRATSWFWCCLKFYSRIHQKWHKYSKSLKRFQSGFGSEADPPPSRPKDLSWWGLKGSRWVKKCSLRDKCNQRHGN